MDFDILFDFLYNGIKKNQIKSEGSILSFSGNFEVRSSEVISRKVNVKSVIVQIPLGKDFNLLVEDLPFNFFISHSIMIGDKTELKIFKFKDKSELYVAEKKVMEKLIEKIDFTTIKEFSVRKLKGANCHVSYNLPQIILRLKEYNKNIKKVNLDVVHIFNGKGVYNFLPTVNNFHLRIAQRLGLELTKLISDNFILDTNINIFDEKSQINLLNPIAIFDKDYIVKFNKLNKHRVYLDFSKEIYFYPNHDEICNKIISTKILNVDKDILINKIQTAKRIRISSNLGEFPLPLWLVADMEKFILVKDKLEFLDLAGVSFDSLKYLSEFKEVYLQSQRGRKGVFCMNSLNSIYTCVFEKHNESEIFYKSMNELILKLSFSNSEIKMIIFDEDFSSEKVLEIEMAIRKLLHFVILRSVEFNKLPFEMVVKDLLGKYYTSISSTLYLSLKNYIAIPIKNKLLVQTLYETRNLIRNLKIMDLKFEYLYDVNNSILALIDILEVFDIEKAKSFRELFNDYFQNQKSKDYALQSASLENFINDIVFVNFLSKKYSVSVVIKKEFDFKLFLKNVVLLQKSPKVNSFIVKPNKKYLKKIFPYSYVDAQNQIRGISSNAIKYSSIKINEKLFQMKPEYYELFEFYDENYRCVLSNEYFLVLVK